MLRDDPFSFTFAGEPWVADQWLAECGMAAVHRLAGWDGLLLLTATLLAASTPGFAARLLRGGLHLLPAGLLLAVAMLVGSPQFHVRPLVLTIGLLGVTFALAGRRRGRPPKRLRQLWWLVPLFVLWTNLHGGVLAGIGTVGCALSAGSPASFSWGRHSSMDVGPDAMPALSAMAAIELALLAGRAGRLTPAGQPLRSGLAAGMAGNADHAAAER